MFWVCLFLTFICITVTIIVGMLGSILAAVFGVGAISMAIITYFAWEDNDYS